MDEITKTRVALVVDDEHFARLFAMQILLDRDFVVLEAADAAEGAQMLRDNEDVSILITDVAMPGEVDGLGLAAQAMALRPGVGVVLVSGHAPPIRLPTADQVFVPKPYTPRALLEAVQSVWGGEILPGSAPLPMTALGSIAAA